jgi:hypothetical protein
MFKTLSNDELVTATGGINWGQYANMNTEGHVGGPLINRPTPPTIPPLPTPGEPYKPSPTFDPGPRQIPR